MSGIIGIVSDVPLCQLVKQLNVTPPVKGIEQNALFLFRHANTQRSNCGGGYKDEF